MTTGVRGACGEASTERGAGDEAPPGPAPQRRAGPASPRRTDDPARDGGPLRVGGLGAGMALALCVAVALALRLHALDGPSLWMDEIATVTMAGLPWSELVGPIARQEVNPPGYFGLVKLLGPVTDTGFRLPSAVAGAAAVVPVALFTRRAFGIKAAAAAALLLAVSAAHIHYSQQARTYAILFLLVASALWLADGTLDGDDAAGGRRRRWLRAGLFGAACAAMLHLHATAVFAIAGLYAYAAVALLASRRLSWNAVAPLLVAGLLALAACAWWLRIALEIVAAPQPGLAWIERPDLAAAASIVSNVLGALYLDRIRLPMVAACGALLAVAAAVAVRRRDARALGLFAALGSAAAGLFVASQFTAVMLERTSLFLLAFALPLYGFALSALRPRGLALASAALLLALHLRGTQNRAAVMRAQGHEEDWRGAVAALEQRFRPGEAVVVYGGFDVGAVAHYAPRLAAGLPLWALPLPNDHLAFLLLERLPGSARWDATEPCAGTGGLPRGGAGLWTVGREETLDREPEKMRESMALRGSVPTTTEAFGRVVLRHWSPIRCEGNGR